MMNYYKYISAIFMLLILMPTMVFSYPGTVDCLNERIAARRAVSEAKIVTNTYIAKLNEYAECETWSSYNCALEAAGIGALASAASLATTYDELKTLLLPPYTSAKLQQLWSKLPAKRAGLFAFLAFAIDFGYCAYHLDNACKSEADIVEVWKVLIEEADEEVEDAMAELQDCIN